MSDIYETIKGCNDSQAYCSGIVHAKRVCNLTRDKIDCRYQSNKVVQHGRFTSYYVCDYSKKSKEKSELV